MSVHGFLLLLHELHIAFVAVRNAVFLSHYLVKVFLKHGDIILEIVLLLTHFLLVFLNLVIETLGGAFLLLVSTAFEAVSLRVVEVLELVDVVLSFRGDFLDFIFEVVVLLL